MDFVIEDISPVRKKITITAASDETDKALNAALQHFRKDMILPGFRRGKVPASLVEKRFANDIKAHVLNNWLGEKLDSFISENNILILSRPEYEGGEIDRGQKFNCSLSFDVMPKFDLPEYMGLEASQSEVTVSDAEVDNSIKNLQGLMAEDSKIDEVRHPQDGESVHVDFAGFIDGVAVPDVKGENFRVVLGNGQVLPDFETIIKELKPGEEKEGQVNFPADYAHKDIAGKSVTMRIKLNSLNRISLPELDEDFAKKVGLESIDKLRDSISDSIKKRKDAAERSLVKQKLLDELLLRVDFPLPQTLISAKEERILGDARIRMGGQKSEAKEIDEAIEAMKPQAKKQAEEFVRAHLLLMSIARKENISASEQEADRHLYQAAMQTGQNFADLRKAYLQSGLMGELLESIQAEKALDFIYDKANITVSAKEKSTKADTNNEESEKDKNKASKKQSTVSEDKSASSENE